MSSYTIKGRIIKILDTHVISEKFKKREFVISDGDDKYPQTLIFQLIQDKCEILDEYEEGEEVLVHFNLKGREWTSPKGEVKWFNSLEAWRLEKNMDQSAYEEAEKDFETDDDLPF